MRWPYAADVSNRRRWLGPVGLLGVAAGGAAGTYLLAATGTLTVDTGGRRRTRPPAPMNRSIAAPPEVVFDVIGSPYLGKTTRAMSEKLRVLERGDDMVLAAHFTPLGHRLTATTVETVRFERPHQVAFRLLRGPVPHVTETFRLTASDDGTAFTYTGEIGADFWSLGRWWTDVVGARWEHAVEESLAGIIEEAERRAASTQRSG